MEKAFRERRFFYLGGAILIALIVFFLNQAGVFNRLEFMTLDARFRLRGTRPMGKDLVIVGITQNCLNKLGKYPFNRSYHARLIDFLKNSGAKVISYDIYFISPSANKKEDIALIGATRRAGNVLYPVYYPATVTRENFYKGYLRVDKMEKNLPPLEEAAWDEGHINTFPDTDEVVRKIPLLLKWESQIYFHSSLLNVLKYKEIPPQRVIWKRDKGFIQVGDDIRIPVDKYGNMWVNFTLGSQIPRYDFYRVLSGEVSPSVFKDKIVLVGQMTTGVPFADIIHTPLGPKYGPQFGIVVIANATDTILQKVFFRTLSSPWNLVIMVLFSLLCIFTVARFRFLGAALATLFLMTVVFWLGVGLFKYFRVIVGIVPLWSIAILNLAESVFLGFRRAEVAIKEGQDRLEALLEVSKTTTSFSSQKRGLDTIVATIAQALEAALCILREYDERKGELSIGASCIPSRRLNRKEVFEWDNQLAQKSLQIDYPLFLPDVRTGESPPPEGLRGSLLFTPLRIEGEVIGTLSVYGRNSTSIHPHSYREEDLREFLTLSHQVAVALKNARLYRDMENLFLEAVKALSAAIDAKDPYTEGHSERVTHYAMAIAGEMGMSLQDRENLRLAASLHDIGKIGISEKILRKQSRLDRDEYSIIQGHPSIGASILEHIQQLSPVIPGMRHHHEHYDGTGYPEGLKGKDIPLIARVLAVADAYDAMTSDRPYRSAYPHEYAVREISQGAGSQFDPFIVEIFLKCIAEKKIGCEVREDREKRR